MLPHFYSPLTPDWLYEWQLSLPLRHSPHPLLQHPSHQQKQNKRTSHLLLLVNDWNKSHHPLLSPMTGGGRKRKVQRWENSQSLVSPHGCSLWRALCVWVNMNEWTHNASPYSVFVQSYSQLSGSMLNGPSCAITKSRGVEVYMYVSVINYRCIHTSVSYLFNIWMAT